MKGLFTAEPQSVCEEAHTFQCLIIHKYLEFASQLFYVLPRVGDWKATQETHSNTSITMKAERNQREHFKLRDDFLFYFNILYNSTDILLHIFFN